MLHKKHMIDGQEKYITSALDKRFAGIHCVNTYFKTIHPVSFKVPKPFYLIVMNNLFRIYSSAVRYINP